MSDGDESYSNKEQPTRHHPVQSASFTKGQKKSRHVSIIAARNPQGQQFYQPTPAPETVIVHSVPKKTNDACCWGCAAALCLCFGLEECCT